MPLNNPKILEVLETYGEADVLIDNIVDRYKKGLYTFTLVQGLPGTGKSYFTLRLYELLRKRFEEQFGIVSPGLPIVISSLLELIKVIREFPNGSILPPIEEVSVLFPSKRAMSQDNVAIGQILDTIRKKKFVLFANAPMMRSIEKHMVSMSNYLIETKIVDKTMGISKCRILRLQTNVRNGITYFHTMSRKSTNKPVNSVFARKPSEDIIKLYESSKDDFMDELYDKLQKKAEKKADEEMRSLGIDTGKPVKKKALTPYQEEMYQLIQSLPPEERTVEVLAKKMNSVARTISKAYQGIKNQGWDIELRHK